MKKEKLKQRKQNIGKLKKQVKGITLIALVVTIIVLLILSSVAISLTIGSNGIFTRAQDAVKKYEEASANELKAMEELANIIGEKNSGNEENPGEETDDDLQLLKNIL